MADRPLNIAVLSGKGGTGKTLISVNLASVAGNSTYIDCDVEEPNGHLFFQPKNLSVEKVTVKLPYAEAGLCTGCRRCVDFCMFNALAFVKSKPMLFDEICHSCGGCVLVCPVGAMKESEKQVGEIQRGESDGVRVVSGFMNTGEASGIPVIRKMFKETEPCGCTVIDCPPGSACIVMESIKDAGYCVLAAEPTIFGVHNLSMVHELVRVFEKPFGVVLNKCQDGINPAEEYCISNDIPILGKIPFDPELGKISSEAQIAARVSERYRELFADLLGRIKMEAGA
jgi:MinD superfamily P-loop ATPase